MFTWRLKEYAGVNEKGESLFYKNVKDEAGNITGRETTTNHAQADYYITEESSIPKVLTLCRHLMVRLVTTTIRIC